MRMRKILAGFAALAAMLATAGTIGAAPATAALELPPGVTAAEYAKMKAAEARGDVNPGIRGHKAPPRERGNAAAKKADGLRDGRSALLTSTVHYFYAGGWQQITNTGGYANIDVANPYWDSADDAHSLMEIAVIRNTGLTPNLRDVVEIGWGKGGWCPGGTATPCLFGFSWDDAVPNPGGYNAGFVDYAPNPVDLGDNLPVTASGCRARLGIQLFNGDWWLALDQTNTCMSGTSNWLGYFPASNWPSGTAFNTANDIHFFGEVVGINTPGDVNEDGYPASDMGRGYLATASGSTTVGQDSQRIGTVSILGQPNSAVDLDPFTSGPSGWTQPSPGRYESHIASGSVLTNVRTIRIGGPGYVQGTGTGAGITGG